MVITSKRKFYIAASFIMIFFAGYAFSSGLFQKADTLASDKLKSQTEAIMTRHLRNLYLYPGAKNYFLVSEPDYSKFINEGPSLGIFITIFFSAIFNVIFQPVFLSVLTPQSILNYLLFPFFLFGAVRHFKKIWFLLVVYLLMAFYVGTRGSVVEVLVRHRMVCDLIYLLIGLAGFTTWIGES